MHAGATLERTLFCRLNYSNGMSSCHTDFYHQDQHLLLCWTQGVRVDHGKSRANQEISSFDAVRASVGPKSRGVQSILPAASHPSATLAFLPWLAYATVYKSVVLKSLIFGDDMISTKWKT